MSEDRIDPNEPRDDVARLIRLAGKRRAVPPERAGRVRAAARAQWQDEVRRRSRRRAVWAAGGLAAAAALLLVAVGLARGWRVPPAPEASIRVESVAGRAWTRGTADDPGAAPRPLQPGDDVSFGARVVTAEDGRVALRLPSGHSLRLDSSTRLRLLDRESIALGQGALYADSGVGGAGERPLRVHTPLGVVEEIGTQFEVRLGDDSVRVLLREGRVIVRREGKSHEVAAGTRLELGADGTVRRSELTAYGDAWSWLAEVTPMPDFEGMSTRAFLGWAARERGWTLAFADERVARAAEETVLAGAAGDLTIEEALDVVLPISRMTYRVEDGVLLVSAQGADGTTS